MDNSNKNSISTRKTYGSSPSIGNSSNQNMKIAWIAVVIVVIGLGIFFAIKFTSSKSSGASSSLAPAAVVSKVTNVAPSTYNAAGTGANLYPPIKLKPTAALTKANLPRIVYIGAEYCPYCAAERWAVVDALSRFGTFSNLRATHSSTTDVYPNTQTFSFYKSSYKSKYVSFTPVETQSNQPQGNFYAPLQKLTSTESQLFNTYDKAPYTTVQGGIPFIDIANKFLITGATYNPQILSGKSLSQIASDVSNPNSNTGKEINASANLITAAICSATNNQPASACSSSVVQGSQHFINSLPAK